MTLVQWCLVYSKINNESDMWNAVYLTYMYNQIVVSKLRFLIAIRKGTGQYSWKMNWFLFIDHNVRDEKLPKFCLLQELYFLYFLIYLSVYFELPGPDPQFIDESLR